MTLVIEGAYVVPVAGEEIPDGHVVIEGDRIAAVGPGAYEGGGERIDGRGCVVTPGLVNTHHHLYQWATQGLAKDGTLFEWLVASYPVWARMDAEVVHGAATAGLGWLALSGCTTSTDHHYVFPSGRGDLFAAEVEAARRVGLRFHPCRGSMDRGESQGGLPPDEVVESIDAILAHTEEVIAAYHDPSYSSMLRVAVAPCSPFSVSRELMTASAELARARGVRLHTHLAETLDEEEHCREQFGVTPVEYLDDLGWLGPDVWLAHCVHLREKDVARFAATGTGTAHCPSSNARLGAGIARASELLRAGAPIGLGVDGAASAEMTPLVGEVRMAMLMQRARYGPAALTAREALAMATAGGARCLGRQDELGTLEPGRLADIAVWRVDGYHAAIDDPVVALVYGSPPPLARLLVGGATVVEDGELRTIDGGTPARAGAEAHRRLLRQAAEPG
ncbi:cytosine/adenosine deaminase-related metal-dependent hydrolase [Thermocatellispora tengchongensis]|uniref:Cytosine/adenosine deaminase-related metal-dependent hydrolase n=1 Tax=Thermocatellispora tengchongensis TaxID=1073253 RepID=A0A840NZJ1_9ACTN|nr:8-oxoguanine deaminase [Thermocatellispora tengchongensis]MBB5131626.1 cytosine/adenosine deaminase-related metal-dependent hydrolase [Thermocatellispora tengchongensis]